MLRIPLVAAFSAAGPRVALQTGAARQLTAAGRRQLASTPRPPSHGRQQAAGRAFAAFAGHDKAFKNASCKEVSELLNSGSAKYLDVRTPQEFAAGHPPGAVNVPVMVMPGMAPNPDFLKEVEALFADKGVPVVVGCKSGKRSEAACNIMTQAGFSGLTNMLGGFDAWQAEGLPVEA